MHVLRLSSARAEIGLSAFQSTEIVWFRCFFIPKIPCMAYGSRDTKKERHKTAAPLKSGLAFGKITAMELPAHDLATARTVRMDQAGQIFYAPMGHRSANPYAQMSLLSSADSFATISAVSLSLSVTSSLVPYAST